MLRNRMKRIFSRANTKLREINRNLGGDGTDYSPPPPARDAVQIPDDQIPPHLTIQPGRGDAPGPNHKSDVSISWVSAQIVSGVAPFLIDLRPPSEYSHGHIPGAISMYQISPADHGERLPDKELQVVLYDEDGLGPSEQEAQRLRKAGWARSRRLVGGFQAWRKAGEPIDQRSS